MTAFNKPLIALMLFFLSALALSSAIPAGNEYLIGRDAINLVSRVDAIAAAGSITASELHMNNNTAATEQLHKTFAAVMEIPDSVLKEGDQATAEWLTTHGYRSASNIDREADGWWQDTECALAIAAFLGSNLVSAAKIIRIKDYIEALGGVAEAAELLLKASTWTERLAEGGSALVSLAAEILGFSIIKNACT